LEIGDIGERNWNMKTLESIFKGGFASCLIAVVTNSFAGVALDQPTVDLAHAVVVIRPGQLPKAEQAAAEAALEDLGASGEEE